MSLRARRIIPSGMVVEQPWASIRLDAASRHLRRKLLTLSDGTAFLVDLEKTTRLEDRDCFLLDDGRLIAVAAEPERLMELRGDNPYHLARLAWHIGNRHLEAQIEPTRILLRPDPVIATMLLQLGAQISDVTEPFSPEHGAYHHHG